jgi:hypothetical protein
MTHRHHARRSSASAEYDLWFDMSSSARRQQESSRAPEPSAYRATTHRLSTGSSTSASTRTSTIPSISTTANTNKPLPPSPTDSERKRRKPAYLRSMLGRSSSSQLDPNHLQPRPYDSHHRNSAASGHLNLDTYSSYHHAYSRSMPSSPYDYNQAANGPLPSSLRASSAAANYQDATEYQPYTPPLQQESDTTYFARPPRSSSMNTYYEISPPRARTFPAESSTASPAMREGVSNRPRPHTWLSPTDSFSDPSQFSLFVQATTGLPEDSDSFSPSGPPQLQGSLFARRSANDVIPIPLQSTSAAAPRHFRTDWQNFEPPPFTHHAPSGHSTYRSRRDTAQQSHGTPHMAAVTRELEMLGLEDDDTPDEELPNYAQSQAEAHARSRAEASARARELETRWRNTRGSTR